MNISTVGDVVKAVSCKTVKAAQKTQVMSSQVIKFHKYTVTRQVFYKTASSYGIVNMRPLIRKSAQSERPISTAEKLKQSYSAGHVLICPMRVVTRLADLSPGEITDLFLSVQKVGKVIEKEYGGQGLTMSCQDGSAAGQSVPHVHIHLLPRRTTDFNGQNDDVYPALERNEHELDESLSSSAKTATSERSVMTVPKDEDRPCRTDDDMAQEADRLASLFGDDR